MTGLQILKSLTTHCARNELSLLPPVIVAAAAGKLNDGKSALLAF